MERLDDGSFIATNPSQDDVRLIHFVLIAATLPSDQKFEFSGLDVSGCVKPPSKYSSLPYRSKNNRSYCFKPHIGSFWLMVNLVVFQNNNNNNKKYSVLVVCILVEIELKKPKFFYQCTPKNHENKAVKL